MLLAVLCPLPILLPQEVEEDFLVADGGRTVDGGGGGGR